MEFVTLSFVFYATADHYSDVTALVTPYECITFPSRLIAPEGQGFCLSYLLQSALDALYIVGINRPWVTPLSGWLWEITDCFMWRNFRKIVQASVWKRKNKGKLTHFLNHLTTSTVKWDLRIWKLKQSNMAEGMYFEDLPEVDDMWAFVLSWEGTNSDEILDGKEIVNTNHNPTGRSCPETLSCFGRIQSLTKFNLCRWCMRKDVLSL